MPVDWDTIQHFKRGEWGTDPDMVDPRLVLYADKLRERAGVAVHIHCAYDPSGHSERSRHKVTKERPLTDAFDFHFAFGLTHRREYDLITADPIVGAVGFYPFWRPRPGWHVDLRPRPRVYWYRTEFGIYRYGRDNLEAALDIFGGEE